MTHTDYAAAIAKAADLPVPTPAQLAQMQSDMWARHRCEAWRVAPVATLTAGIVGRRARRVETVL